VKIILMNCLHASATLNEFLTFRRRNILHDSGKVSKEDMERRAFAEYAKFNIRRLKSPGEMPDDEPGDVDELNNATKTKI
jgi:hypothetical protein